MHACCKGSLQAQIPQCMVSVHAAIDLAIDLYEERQYVLEPSEAQPMLIHCQ